MYQSRAVRAEDWPQVRDGLLKDGWQFRNSRKPDTGSDVADVFWSSDGDPDIRMGVIYLRRPVKQVLHGDE